MSNVKLTCKPTQVSEIQPCWSA